MKSIALFALVAVAAAVPSSPGKGYRLVQMAEDESPFWISPRLAHVLSEGVTHYIDVTENDVVPHDADLGFSSIPSGPRYQSEVNGYLPSIDINRLQNFLEKFSSYQNRYYTSNYGVQSTAWLLSQVEEAAANRTDIKINYFKHSFAQPSIIARIEGKMQGETVVLGGHLDSTARGMPNGRAPGADDDGTGSMTVLEAFRVLVANGFQPDLPVEFHWYAAEEAGLLGSGDIARTYASENAAIRGMMQVDMCGYPADEFKVAFVRDNTDNELTNFAATLVDEYLEVEHRDTLCGYGCSDHASWTRQGYKAIFPFEAAFSKINPYIHTDQDTTSKVDFKFAAEWSKLAIAFVIELSHP